MISIVIPAYNEESSLPATLESLVNQKCAEPYEVVLVDNASTDATALVANSFAGRLRIRVISEPIKGRGIARATGCKNAAGEIFLSTDADTVLPANWVTSLVSVIRAGAVGATGTSRVVDCSWLANGFFNSFQPALTKFLRLCMGHYWLAGFSSGVTKNAYEKAGGYDPALNAIEDIDLAKRVAKIGQIKYVTNCPVVFSGRRFRKGMVRGLLAYVPPFVRYVLHQRRVVLDDVR